MQVDLEKALSVAQEARGVLETTADSLESEEPRDPRLAEILRSTGGALEIAEDSILRRLRTHDG